MPLFDYACEACGHTFEVLQKYSDPPPPECPSCGGKIERLVSAPAIQFKGTGWYVTDYAKKGVDPSAAGKEDKKEDKMEKKEEKKETKTDSGSKASEKSSSSKDS